VGSVSKSDNQKRSPETAAEPPAHPNARYADLDLDDEVVIYDRENHRAWIQSDASVEVTAML